MNKWMLVMAAGIVFYGGCQRPVFISGPPRTDHYYVNPRGDLSQVGRVALLELENQSTSSDLPEVLTVTLADELGKRHLFSIQKVMKSDSLWQSLKLSNLNIQSFDELAALRQALNVDAVVLGTIQRYQSFPHLQMSLNVRLVDLRTGKLLWAVEDVWDSSDKTVEDRMKIFFKEQMRSGYEPMDWQILVTSPRAFDRFVAYEVALTLPK